MDEADLYASTTVRVETIDLDYFIRYMDAVREYWDELTGIKENLQNDMIEAAKACHLDIPEEPRQLLWRATTKGSVYTTEERRLLKDG